MNAHYSYPCFAIVIVHGQSERLFVQAVKQICHSHIKIIGRHNRNSGSSSIQIDHLGAFINKNTKLKTPDAINATCKFPTKNKSQNRKRWNDFHIYTVMDVDDIHGKDIKKNYLKGHVSGISNKKISNHTIGIFNDPNLEPTLKYGCHMDKITYKKKGYKHYSTLFTNEMRTIPDVKRIRDELNKYPKTNMNILLDDCLDPKHIPRF